MTAEGKVKSGDRRFITIIILLAIALIWIGFRIALPDNPTFFAGSRPDNLGINQGQSIACPATPNCVSSQSDDAEHYIEPLAYKTSASDAIAKLKNIIENQERAKLISATDNYLYAEFTSRWMGYVDDVEFSVNKKENVIEVRSASRLGESDLGVNRQRIETIRSQFNRL
jgi:uncharacterized protein (DUF1499 family)